MTDANSEKKEPGATTPASVPPGSQKQGCAPSFLMEERGEMDKLCGEVQPDSKEEYVQPDKEKEAGGEG